MDSRLPLVIGLTGGIGCGKSTVADLFGKHGAGVIDSDEIAHRVSASGGRAIDALRAAFGDQYITPEGALDRVRMRTLAFSDDAARLRLEGILHPVIRDESDAALRACTSPYAVLVVPLLFESASWRQRVARALVVDCPESIQIERVMARSKLSREQVEAIMARQVSRAQRLSLADDIIDNSGALEPVRARVRELDLAYRTLASEHARL